ncbi:MAG: hypothetical protein K4571_20375 [Deltaproteobacteria bacterium]
MMMGNLLVLLTVVSGVLGLLFFVVTFKALRKKKIVSSTIRLLCALLGLSLALLFGTISIAIQGYRALTHEEIAAVVRTEPRGARSFMAYFTFPDGREASYQLAGDALYVDAHILKWKPFVNILGLHTAYELDRVSGRYLDIKDELSGPRTVFSISPNRVLNMFNLRQRYLAFSPLLDAEYGSASFINLDKAAKFEIRVSTTGLLIRKIEP